MQKMGNKEKDNVVVFCLDYDGCADCIFYNGEINFEHPIVKEIIKEIENKKTNKIYISIGSLRQCHRDDRDNGVHNKNGSCFKNYRVLVEELNTRSKNKGNIPKVEFYPLTMTDIKNKLPVGTHYKSSSQLLWNFDRYKSTILISQAHYLALDEKNSQIDFRFIDDKSSLDAELKEEEDITGRLVTLFERNPYLVPEDSTFRAYFCNSDSTEIRQHGNSVSGKGSILGEESLRAYINEIPQLYYKPLQDLKNYEYTLENYPRTPTENEIYRIHKNLQHLSSSFNLKKFSAYKIADYSINTQSPELINIIFQLSEYAFNRSEKYCISSFFSEYDGYDKVSSAISLINALLKPSMENLGTLKNQNGCLKQGELGKLVASLKLKGDFPSSVKQAVEAEVTDYRTQLMKENDINSFRKFISKF